MKMTALLPAILLLWFLPTTSWAGAWTLPRRKLWVKSAIFYQSTRNRFCTEQEAQSLAFREAGCTAAGHSAPFDPFIGGESQALAVFTELAYGATGWLDLGAQIPFYSLKFTNLANPNRPRNNSFGDIRFFGKYRMLQQPVVASIMISAKSPTGKFNVDAEAVNVSEGQWDIEFIGEVSRSFWLKSPFGPLKGYASLGVGYRIRTDNKAFEHTMGDEFMIIAEAGYDVVPHVMIKGAVDWLRGARPRLKANHAPLLEHRELLAITPSVIYAPREGFGFEASVRFAISGEDFPDGTQFMGTLFYSFSVL